MSDHEIANFFTKFLADIEYDCTSFRFWNEIKLCEAGNDYESKKKRQKFGLSLLHEIVNVGFQAYMTHCENAALENAIDVPMQNSQDEEEEEPNDDDFGEKSSPSKNLFRIDSKSRNYVPETCAIINRDFEDQAELTNIPETQESEDLLAIPFSRKSRKRKSEQQTYLMPEETYEDFGIDKPGSEKVPKKSPEQVRDEQIREKYPQLTNFQILKTEQMNGSGCGVFGNSTENQKPSNLEPCSQSLLSPGKDLEAEEDDPFEVKSDGILIEPPDNPKFPCSPCSTLNESQSLLPLLKRNVERGKKRMEEEEAAKKSSIFENSDSESLISTNNKRIKIKDEKHESKSSTPPAKRKIKSAKNSYGMTVEPATDSQIHRFHHMKQGSIDSFLKKPGNTSNSQIIAKKDKSPKVKEEEFNDDQFERDMETAKANSLMKSDNSKSAVTKTLIRDDSMDDFRFDETFSNFSMPNDENNSKIGNGPVRKKADREKLQGFDCKECEAYYANANFSTNQLEELIQKCSRHRAQQKPTSSDTPKNIWDTSFAPDGPEDRTQMPVTLRTRKNRKK